MAIIATLQANESCVPSGAPAGLVLAIKNTGAAALNIQNITIAPQSPAAPVLVPQTTFAPASTTQILANGTVYVPVSVTPFALPQLSTAPAQQGAVGIVASVTMTDGTNAVSQPVTLQVVPTTTPPTPLPVAGQFDFTSNNNSALWALGWFRP